MSDNFIKPLGSLAVPEFFVISSFLFFIKARKNGFSFDVLWNFLKRLVLLYLFWVIVWLPIILIQNDYGKEGIINGVGFFVRDFFFGHTFDASWFLGALITGMPIVWLLGKYLKEKLAWVVPLIIYLYLRYQSLLPICWQKPYQIYSSFQPPYHSFLGGMLWLSIGYYLSNSVILGKLKGAKNIYAWLGFWGGFIIMVCDIVPVVPMVLCVIVLFIASYMWKLPDYSVLYKRFRTYSILFYVIHDSFKKIPKQLFGWENGPLLFFITLLVCFIASEIIIRMKDIKGFNWLRFAY